VYRNAHQNGNQKKRRKVPFAIVIYAACTWLASNIIKKIWFLWFGGFPALDCDKATLAK
jgi:hypothetical protein